ncbi:hypothetical protein [Anaeroselena agilis]|uniref:Uncharacterized protein n=1 Tax=Anaeroselena agilis TaxID=3063788 RepID=A0ABU3NVQ9_9FIRM|nr:hypothetical protein [Selenomonadales bacterium 4137-cl]
MMKPAKGFYFWELVRFNIGRDYDPKLVGMVGKIHRQYAGV